MRRQDLLREIARLDDEINSTVAAAELPRLDYRPFPKGTWLFALLMLGWAEFGGYIPGSFYYHLQTARYDWYLGLVIALVAVLSTISWFMRSRGYKDKSEAYTEASRRARGLQERRRELQMELRALSEDL